MGKQINKTIKINGEKVPYLFYKHSGVMQFQASNIKPEHIPKIRKFADTRNFQVWIEDDMNEININIPTVEKKHGGSRPGAGRPPQPYKSKKISFRVREEHEAPVREAVKEKINQLNQSK